MSFSDFSDKFKKNQISGYDPKDHGTRYYRKDDYDQYNFYIKKDPLEEIIECRDILRSAYANRPSYAYMEKVLTHALAEITNLRKKVTRLESDVSEFDKDIIEIKIGDETVVVDGDLATQVISLAVRNYITEALEAYCNAHESKE